MRLLKPVLLLCIMLMAIGTASAQTTPAATCDGSLGDPVINQDFGSGQNPGAALPSTVTNMTYISGNCPEDGQYTIYNSLTGSGNCHQDTWHNVASDHTGNPNGYMMVINASKAPSIFFTQSAPTLCPGTTYQFSAWILNLIKNISSTSGFSEPDLTFEIDDINGKQLATFDTGTIPRTDTPTWVQESIYFTTTDVASVIVKITNNAPGGDGNDLILDDITFRACGPLIQAGVGSTTGGQNQPVCEGTVADYTFKASVTGNNFPQYQWQQYLNNAWQDITGATTNTYTAHTDGTVGIFQYRVGITNGTSAAASCRVYSSPLTVTVNPNPVITGVNATQSICAGQDLVLSAVGGTSYQWSGPGLPATTQNPVTIKNVSAANAGTYTVTAYSQYGCSSTASTAVTVNPVPVVSVAGSTTICAGDATTISAAGGLSYSWSPGKTLSDSTSANPIATPTDTTVYTVTATNQFGCIATGTVIVNVEKKAIANAGSNKVIFEGQTTKLNGSQKYGATWYWSPATALSDPTALSPAANPTDDITYTLHVQSANNCGDDSSHVFVKVYKKIIIPNTFSPNGDGVNDQWNIEALITYPDCLLLVFDRYGQQVYKSTGYAKPWDGRTNGKVLPTGTYYYVIDLKNNTPKLSGWLLITR